MRKSLIIACCCVVLAGCHYRGRGELVTPIPSSGGTAHIVPARFGLPGRGCTRGWGNYFLRQCCRVPLFEWCYINHTARRRGGHSFKRYQKQCGRSLCGDFQNGYLRAYVDVANGGNGATPAVPPEDLWTAPNRSSDGFARAQQWFDGYATGAIQADRDGLKSFNTVPLSPATGELNSLRTLP